MYIYSFIKKCTSSGSTIVYGKCDILSLSCLEYIKIILCWESLKFEITSKIIRMDENQEKKTKTGTLQMRTLPHTKWRKLAISVLILDLCVMLETKEKERMIIRKALDITLKINRK